MKTHNIKMVISYDGTNYFGFKSQLKHNTVEKELLKALKIITDEDILICCAGRTDTGVHAEGQVINFFSGKLKLNEDNWLNALNMYLPPDIRVLDCEFTDADFNSRKSACYREYRYQIINSHTISALKNRYAALYRRPVDVELLNKYAAYLIGEHDFTSFCASTDQNLTKSRFIHTFEITRENELITFRIIGNAFLHKMIRNIIGTMLLLSKNGKGPEEMEKILNARDRNKAGPTYTPRGLNFYKVYYTEDI